MIHLLINKIPCFRAHLSRPRPRYITVENIVKYSLQENKQKKVKTAATELELKSNHEITTFCLTKSKHKAHVL